MRALSKDERKREKISLMFFIFLALSVFILDRISKFIVIKKIFPDESIPVFEKIFSITYVRNTGTAFGLFAGANTIFVLISTFAIILIVIILFRLKQNDFLVKSSLALIMAGALGNLTDRLIFGYVIDFLDFKIWPVFNLADASITIGCILLLFKMFRGEKEVK